MTSYLCCCRFVGTAYRGYQVQVQDNTVCHVLQDALTQLFHVRPDIKGCSRTDSGVHAHAFYFSFQTRQYIDPAKLPIALNRFLPGDVAVTGAQLVPEDFHARYHCLGKEYVYRVINRPIRDPFLQDRALFYGGKIDAEQLNRAGRAFLGRQDFTSFCGRRGSQENKVRTVTAFDVVRLGDEIRFRVRGDGFLYHMVRIMVGTLLQVAQGVFPEDGIAGILAAKDRRAAGMTAPACGLYLHRVFYDPSIVTLGQEEDDAWLK